MFPTKCVVGGGHIGFSADLVSVGVSVGEFHHSCIYIYIFIYIYI